MKSDKLELFFARNPAHFHGYVAMFLIVNYSRSDFSRYPPGHHERKTGTDLFFDASRSQAIY